MKTMILAALAALAVQSGPNHGIPSDELFAETRSVLDDRLLDYPSTRFKDVAADAEVICGSLNSKNRMGAYTGWTKFGAFRGDSGLRVFIDDPDEPSLMLDLFCGQDRRPQSTDYSDRLTYR